MTRLALFHRVLPAAGPVALAALFFGLVSTADAAAVPARIAFSVSTDPRSNRILVAAPDGSGARVITDGKSRDRAPAFSPDGKHLAYQSSSDLGLDTIMVASVDGPPAPRTLAVGSQPQWSHDGKSLLFSRRLLNEYNLYTIRADGSQKDEGLKPLAKGQLGRWSPDEKQLALVSSVIVEGQDRWQIQVVLTDTLQPRFTLTLPESYGQVVSLEWSPTGEALLFSVSRQDHCDLYTLDLASPEPKRVPPAVGVGSVAPNPAYGSWSANGTEILFRSITDASGGSNATSRLHVMKADGSAIRTVWQSPDRGVSILGTAWQRQPLELVVAKPAPQPQPAPPPVVPPVPANPPTGQEPTPQVVTMKVPGPPKKVHGQKLFVVDRLRSPVSVPIAAPSDGDFTISIPIQPAKTWAGRRQGLGITLEMEDGSLYRGTVIQSGQPWATIQGRPKGGKVRLIDGKQLAPTAASFKKGFKLTIRRDGQSLIVAVDDETALSRPLLDSPVKRAYITLENFDTGKAYFPLGNVYYQPMIPNEVPAPK